MKMGRVVWLVAVLVGVIVLHDAPYAHAASLSVRPLEYTERLAKGERKRGFIDVANPSSSTVTVTSAVQAFRQIDDKGSLQFYDSAQISAGIVVDLKTFTLAPRQAMRVVFEADGSKLPTGNVFAAVFFSTVPVDNLSASSSNQAARLGTLLMLANGTQTGQQAAVTALSADFFQWSGTVHGSYTIKNTSTQKETGFFPVATIAIEPFTLQKTQKSTLVFSGIARKNDFRIDANRFGLFKLSVSYGESQKDQWVFVMYPPLAIVMAVVLCMIFAALYLRRKKRKKPAKGLAIH